MDCPLYLPIELVVANSDLLVNDTEPLIEPHKGACKLDTIGYWDVAWLAPAGDQIVIQELFRPPAIQ